MHHSLDRLAMLNARGGGIPRKDVVMPIDLIYDEIEKVSTLKSSRLARFASMTLSPENHQSQRVHGRKHRMYGNSRSRSQTVCWMDYTIPQKDCIRFEFSHQSFEDGQAWHITNHKILERNDCAMADAEGVVKEFEKMYFAGKERSLIKFEDLLKAMIDFYTAWSRADSFASNPTHSSASES